MSKLPIDLNDRRVVVSVLVLLLAIMTLNWRVFQPLRARQVDRQTAQEEAVYLPPDLGEMTGVAAARLEGGASDAGRRNRAGRATLGAGLRDPFAADADPVPRPAVTRKVRATGTSSRPRPVCTAVLLGGRRPVALIDGARYHPGDRIGAYRIERIDAGGVHLAGAQGRLYLPVGGGGGDAVHHPPVRETRSDGGEREN